MAGQTKDDGEKSEHQKVSTTFVNTWYSVSSLFVEISVAMPPLPRAAVWLRPPWHGGEPPGLPVTTVLDADETQRVDPAGGVDALLDPAAKARRNKNPGAGLMASVVWSCEADATGA